MDAAQHLDELGRVIGEISANGANLAVDLQTPTCPGWSVGDVVTHLGRVHLWAAQAAQSTERPTMAEADLDGRTLGEWYTQAGRTLLDRLRATDPGDACWTFAPGDQTAGFWRRRQLHETTIHQMDLAAAQGISVDIPADVADDGVDELLHLFAPHRIENPERALPLPVAIRATDTGSVWCVQETDGAVEVTRGEEGEVVGEIRSTAVELYLALWGRASRDALHVEGESAPARGFLAQPLVP